MAVKGSIRKFTTKGNTAPAMTSRSLGSGVQIGVRDPATGRIIRGPKPQIDIGLRSKGRVRVLNARAMTGRVAKRHASLGIGLVGDRTY